MMHLVLVWSLSISLVGAFVLPGWVSKRSRAETTGRSFLQPQERITQSLTARFASDVVDVEFEDVEESPPPPKKKRKKRPLASISASGRPSKTLVDLALDSDPEIKELRVPFVDGRNYIDCNLAFLTELDGVTYAIGVPYEHSAAIAIQDAEGSAVYLSPDDDENIELMQIMANELKQEFGQDLALKRTPRVLTISGDLDKYTEGWQDKMFETVDADTLMDESDESEEWFHDFMRKELGEEEYQKTMEDDDFEVDESMLKLFDVPGLGQSSDDVSGMNKMLQDMFNEDPSKPFDAINENLDQEFVSLRLVGFNFKDGKAYSLVQMLKPWTLVARQVAVKDDDMRFELLTADEQKIVGPKLEKLCEKELQEAGLSLKSP